jgi:hypothetical protein
MEAGMKTPDEEVASKIIELFRKAQLLSEAGLKKLYPALVAGKLKAEDWKLLFEADRPSKEKDGRESK